MSQPAFIRHSLCLLCDSTVPLKKRKELANRLRYKFFRYFVNRISTIDATCLPIYLQRFVQIILNATDDESLISVKNIIKRKYLLLPILNKHAKITE